MEQNYSTIDVERRGHGRRYTGLFVDSIDQEGFTIDCSNTYMRPHMFDLRTGDIVRWKQQDRYVQGRITMVTRNGEIISASLEHIELLPPDFFPY